MSRFNKLVLGVLVLTVSVMGSIDAFAQAPVSWALDRIDQRDLPLNNVYANTCQGNGVTIHVLATGVRYTHLDFGPRAMDMTGTGDNLGYGTYWASLAGGADWGVAPGVELRGWDVVTGFQIDWDKVASALIEIFHNGPRPAVILIPWAVPDAQVPPAVRWMLETMVTGCDSAGIGVVVAAGNHSADACDYWPANIPEALTVAATDVADNATPWTNTDQAPGICVDLFAPGVQVTGAWNYHDAATRTLSGTGSSASLAAGAIAKEWSCNLAPNFDFATAVANLLFWATPNVVLGVQDSPNLLLYSR